MTKIIFSPDRKIIGRKTGQLLNLTITETPVSIGGTRVPNTLDDLEYDVITGGTILQNFEVTADDLFDSANLGLDSNNPSVASTNRNTVTDEGVGGSASIFVTRYGYSQQAIARDFDNPPTSSNDSTGYVAGTLGASCLAEMETLINGLTQSNAIQQYLTANNADVDAPDVTINPSVFTGSLDFAATSVMSSTEVDDRYPLALVAGRFGLIAKHVRGGIGREFVFRRTDGTYQKVATQAYTDIPDKDLSIIYLDAAVTGVPFYKTMPLDWQHTYMPSLVNANSAGHIGIIPTLRKAMHSSVDNIWGSYFLINRASAVWIGTGETITNVRVGSEQTGDIPEEWGEGNAIGGDSGSPSFFLINGELILITSQYNQTGAVNIAHYTAEIETAMDTMAGDTPGTNTLTHPDLSGFTTYP